MTSSDTAVLDAIREAVVKGGADSVFGEPVRQDGIIVVPAAKLSGGGGGGVGEGLPTADRSGVQGRGNGGGFGVSARPVGAFVIRKGRVAWRPAVDVNRMIIGAQVVAVVALLTIRTIVRARGKRR